MYSYISGEITEITAGYITLDNQGIGYMINVANPYTFNLNKNEQVFIYQHIKEDENTLYGFLKMEEKNLFMDLISVKGIGPKTALVILAATNVKEFQSAIVNKDITYLSKFPKIGKKSAQQMVLDLEKKYDVQAIENIKQQNAENEELVDALIFLGYDKGAVIKIIDKIDKNSKIEDQVKEGLKLLLKI